MTKGRRNDKTYSRGTPSDRLDGERKLRTIGSGIDGRLVPPSQEAMRHAIASQLCPWCGRGPYKSLSIHTGRTHGVDAAELRELAGLGRFTSICSEDYSATRAEMKRGERLPDSAYGEAQRKPRSLTEFGRRSQREKAARVTDEQRQQAARASGDKQLTDNATKHAEIIRRYQAGEPIAAIISAVGVSRPTVQRTLVREGLWVDGRKRRWV